MIGSIIGPIIGLTTPGGGGGTPPPIIETRFVSTWDTTQAGSASGTIILPMSAGPLVDWGDLTVNNLNTHTYTGTPTSVEIKIDGAVTGWRFNGGGDVAKILTVSNAGQLVMDDQLMFKGCTSMTSWTAGIGTTTTTTTLKEMFRDCTSLASLDFGSFDTSTVLDFNAMFRGVATTSINVSTFDTSSATLMLGMFRNCPNLATITLGGLFDTSLVTDFSTMLFSNPNLTLVTGVEDLVVTSATNMSNFLTSATLSTVQYSDMLINYEAQAVQNNVQFHGGNSQYSAGAAATARAALIADHIWSITDGGQV